jgi:hypothetical protein
LAAQLPTRRQQPHEPQQLASKYQCDEQEQARHPRGLLGTFGATGVHLASRFTFAGNAFPADPDPRNDILGVLILFADSVAQPFLPHIVPSA